MCRGVHILSWVSDARRLAAMCGLTSHSKHFVTIGVTVTGWQSGFLQLVLLGGRMVEGDQYSHWLLRLVLQTKQKVVEPVWKRRIIFLSPLPGLVCLSVHECPATSVWSFLCHRGAPVVFLHMCILLPWFFRKCRSYPWLLVAMCRENFCYPLTLWTLSNVASYCFSVLLDGNVFSLVFC